MSDQLAKYELHICNNILFIYNLIVRTRLFYSTNLAFKQNLRNLNEGQWQIDLQTCGALKGGISLYCEISQPLRSSPYKSLK